MMFSSMSWFCHFQVRKLNDLDNDLDLEIEKDEVYNADDGK